MTTARLLSSRPLNGSGDDACIDGGTTPGSEIGITGTGATAYRGGGAAGGTADAASPPAATASGPGASSGITGRGAGGGGAGGGVGSSGIGPDYNESSDSGMRS